MKTTLKWFLGLVFLLVGIIGLIETPFIRIVSVLIGILVAPPTFALIERKTNYVFTSAMKYTIVVAGVILMGAVNASENSTSDKKVDLIVGRASGFIDQSNIDSALVLIEEAKGKYSSSSNNKALDLEKEIEKSRSLDFAKEILVEMTDEEFTQLKNHKLGKVYISQKTLNSNFIELLTSKAPQRQKFAMEMEAKEKQEKIAAEIAEKEKKQSEIIRERKEKINSQFSEWDESHPALSRLIKDNLNDPDSYEHAETLFRDDEDYIFVITKYRAKNGFGAKVLNTVSAKVDFEGNVVEIVSQ